MLHRSAILRCLAVLLCPAVALASVCPEGTTQIAAVPPAAEGTSWCIRPYSTVQNFCGALKTCHANGEEMISRPVLDAMKLVGSFFSAHYWWIGLTDALHERNSSTDGWVWMADGRATTAEDGAVYFERSEPNDLYYQDCVTTYTSDGKLRDAGCNEENPFYCYSPLGQTAAPTSGGSSVLVFGMSQIATFSQPDPGCWIGHAPGQIGSATSCLAACFAIGRDCVGFYWNSARLECILLPYFDAAVPLSFSNDWEMAQWRKYLYEYSL